MPFDLSTLSTYAKDNGEVLLAAALTGSKTGAIIKEKGTVMTGIKTSERIGVLDTDVVFQNGDGCGFSPSGNTRITQREIFVGNVKIEDSLCVNDLEKKYTQMMMQAGNQADKLPEPIEHTYVDQKVGKTEQAIEKADWQGDTTSGDANLNKYDGFLKLIDNSVGAVTLNAKKGTGTITATTGSTGVTGVGTTFSSQVAVGDKLYSAGVLIGTVAAVGSNTSITLAANGAAAATAAAFNIVPAAVASPIAGSANASNILGILDGVLLGIPEAVLSNPEDGEQPIVFMGWDYARLYLMALKNANLFHFTSADDMLRNGFNIPGFAVRVEPTPGLSGTGRIVAIAPKNMWLGLDLENEEEEVDMWYEKKDDALLSRLRFKRGVQIGFPSEVAQWRAA